MNLQEKIEKLLGFGYGQVQLETFLARDGEEFLDKLVAEEERRSLMSEDERQVEDALAGAESTARDKRSLHIDGRLGALDLCEAILERAAQECRQQMDAFGYPDTVIEFVSDMPTVSY